MSRRTHKKSRAGCTRCKQRHIKCDEGRPVCVNCSTANFDCQYAAPRRVNLDVSMDNDLDHSTDNSPSIPQTAPTTIHASSSSNSPAALTPNSRPLHAADSELNLDHMELLHHFCTVTYKTMSPQSDHQSTWQRVVVKHGLSFPFLLHQILAISALHLAYLTPERRPRYFNRAMEMQSHALEGFNSIQENINPKSCGAILLFSSLLALHVFADRSHIQSLPSGEYLNHLINCLNLMQSVRKVVISEWMPQIAESDLNPLLQFPRPGRPYNIPVECRELEQLPRYSDLGQASIVAYDAAIERLQWTFALADVPATTHSTIRWFLAWPLQLQEGYYTLLNERRPEALIILAYYGVLLHFWRDSWAVGHSGSLIICAINSHIGSHWARWMAWPLQIIGSSP